MAKLRKEMLVQSKPEHCSVIGLYLELQISDLGPFYMDGKVKHRPTTFIWTPRSKNIPEDTGQIMMLAMTSCSDKKIRIVTKSRCGHPLINCHEVKSMILVFRSRSCSCFSDQDHALAFSLCIAYVLLSLISSLCTSFPFLDLVNFFLIYVLILFIYVSFFHYVQLI